MEAFWSRKQVELLDTRRWKTRVELANAIFEYIDVTLRVYSHLFNRQSRDDAIRSAPAL